MCGKEEREEEEREGCRKVEKEEEKMKGKK